MKKLVPVFLFLAAFFFVSGAMAVWYDQARANAPQPPDHTVQLLGDHADSGQIIIKLGETVQFQGNDNLSHDIHQLRADQSSLDSGLLKPSDIYTVRFREAGSFYFEDQLHPKIQVNIVVYDPAK